MRSEEVHGLGQFAGGVAAGVAAQAQQVHAGIAGRVFGLLGAPARGVQLIHDGVTTGAYAGARTLTGVLVRSGTFAYGLTRPSDAPPLEYSPRARLAVGALNGAFGDLLERTGNPLAMPMTIRRRGLALTDAEAIAAAVSRPRSRLVIFIHGLCETEDAWRMYAPRHRPYGDRLEGEQDVTALCVRYNSGRHISHNGRALSECLTELVDAWPVPVTELALVGHSMGGLVARSACHYGADSNWVARVRQVIMLGAPHLGAPLELAANAATAAISRLPEIRPFANPLRARAAGVKDLGYGYVVDEDWEGHDPDALWTDTGTEIPFLESAEHYFVSATLGRDPDAPLSRALGDLLVRHHSAWSHERRHERLRFPLERYRHLGGVSHFQLLNHPAVSDLIAAWVTPRPALLAPRAQLAPPADQRP